MPIATDTNGGTPTLFLSQQQSENPDVVFLPLPFDSTSSYLKGAALAPEAILRASVELETLEFETGIEPFRHIAQKTLQPLVPAAQDSTERYMERIEAATSSIHPEVLLLGIGGNHSITPPLVNARLSQPGTVVQIDAHLDLRETYEGSRHSHACPMRRIHEMGHELIQIGIRSADPSELDYARQYPDAIRVFPAHSIDADWPILMETLTAIRGPVYLTIDVDGLDPTIVPGTGTPVPGGLRWHQACTIIDQTIGAPGGTLVGADVVETIPVAGTVVNEVVAASLLFRILATWTKRRFL